MWTGLSVPKVDRDRPDFRTIRRFSRVLRMVDPCRSGVARYLDIHAGESAGIPVQAKTDYKIGTDAGTHFGMRRFHRWTVQVFGSLKP